MSLFRQFRNTNTDIRVADPDPLLIGPVGPAGPVGPRGPTGDRGIKGPKGFTGDQGPVGERGPDGDRGITGPTGFDGPAGDNIIGNKGIDGERGPTGPDGPAGPDGNKGATGATGPIGARGPTGPDGGVGPTGPAGLDVTGPKGDTGDKGPQGDKGLTGPIGPVGPPGADYVYTGDPITSTKNEIAYTAVGHTSVNVGTDVTIDAAPDGAVGGGVTFPNAVLTASNIAFYNPDTSQSTSIRYDMMSEGLPIVQTDVVTGNVYLPGTTTTIDSYWQIVDGVPTAVGADPKPNYIISTPQNNVTLAFTDGVERHIYVLNNVPISSLSFVGSTNTVFHVHYSANLNVVIPSTVTVHFHECIGNLTLNHSGKSAIIRDSDLTTVTLSGSVTGAESVQFVHTKIYNLTINASFGLIFQHSSLAVFNASTSLALLEIYDSNVSMIGTTITVTDGINIDRSHIYTLIGEEQVTNVTLSTPIFIANNSLIRDIILIGSTNISCYDCTVIGVELHSGDLIIHNSQLRVIPLINARKILIKGSLIIFSMDIQYSEGDVIVMKTNVISPDTVITKNTVATTEFNSLNTVL